MQPPPDYPPEIFDRRRRRVLRERAARRNGDAFLLHRIASEFAERLAMVTREFESALFIGPMAAYADQILGERNSAPVFCCVNQAERHDAVVADEDRLPFVAGSFDLVISGAVLDSVNDLPGALVQIRRILKPDGLFLGQMFGAGSLVTLKSLLIAAQGDRASPHIHPQIDLRSAADLIQRAGFALPVADSDIMTVRYGNWRSIVSDIRDAGIGNALSGPKAYLGKAVPAGLDAQWSRRTDTDGRLEEQFTHLYLSGWAPAENQPKPARRGSGQVSLASALTLTTKL
jgi:NADH dehydrogenase [ubiquinone] 1 alpha subcomplex assembly factor 5